MSSPHWGCGFTRSDLKKSFGGRISPTAQLASSGKEYSKTRDFPTPPHPQWGLRALFQAWRVSWNNFHIFIATFVFYNTSQQSPLAFLVPITSNWPSGRQPLPLFQTGILVVSTSLLSQNSPHLFLLICHSSLWGIFRESGVAVFQPRNRKIVAEWLLPYHLKNHVSRKLDQQLEFYKPLNKLPLAVLKEASEVGKQLWRLSSKVFG